jgi:pyridoxamine 5'-phosphate oxidase
VNLAPRDASLADPLPDSPLGLLGRWIADAAERSGQSNPDAIALASVNAEGAPDARMVLCRGYDAEQGFLSFYTNKESPKARELAARPQACAVFYWDALMRQARVSGPVEPAPDADSDAYFASRHRLSQISAWTSRQSQPLESRAALMAGLEATARRFGGAETGPPIPRPPHWGGYRLWASRIELWVGSDGRAHDRALWTRELSRAGASYSGGPWQHVRLQP